MDNNLEKIQEAIKLIAENLAAENASPLIIELATQLRNKVVDKIQVTGDQIDSLKTQLDHLVEQRKFLEPICARNEIVNKSY